MTVYSITLGDVTPSPRYPPVVTPWTLARFAYAATSVGPFVPFDTITLPNPDADPTAPAARNLTTLQSPSPSGFFEITFIDGIGTEDPVAPVFFPSAAPDHDYVNLSALKSTLELQGETFADDDLALAITAASRAIDTLARRRFWLDPDANQVRYYTARSRRLLEIDDLVTFTALDTDEKGDGSFSHSWVRDTDFVLEPFNAVADGEPFASVTRRPASQFILPDRIPRGVRLTGQFGWPQVPSEIQEASGILASRLMRRAREAPFGVIGFAMDQGNVVHLARQDPDVMMLAGPYQHIQSVI